MRLDAVAALRETYKGRDPDPVAAAVLAELAGADGVVVHLREDCRHIQERDVRALRDVVRRLILEVSLDPALLRFALEVQPIAVRIVPLVAAEITTSTGLDCTRDTAGTRLLALAILATCAAAVAWLVSFGG